MVLRTVDKKVLARMRSALKKEQVRTGRRFPKRVLKLFGRLKNIDERKLREWPNDYRFIRSVGRKDRGPGYGVRAMKVKGKEIVLKLPTLASKHYKVTPQEEIRFVRKMVEMVNARHNSTEYNLMKPIGHPVGPFIAMRKTNFPTIEDFQSHRSTPKARKMLSKLAKQMQLPEEKVNQMLQEIGSTISLESFKILMNKQLALSKNYPATSMIENKKRISYLIRPLDSRHLQIIGQKNGVIQIVPYINAI